jgi:hypothetical protein
MFQNLLDSLFGCSHQRTTFPITRGRKLTDAKNAGGRTYIVCLDCGKEFGYDWKAMRVGQAVELPVTPTATEPLYR